MVAVATPSDRDPLTPRERDILRLMAVGLSDREIAARLHLDPQDIVAHSHKIFRKLGVENRKQAIERAAALGLLGSMSSNLEPLTDRERQILVLIAEDLRDREIAARLHLSPTTVKWYNRQIFPKLGVENRKQAAERASALGLFEAPPDHDTPPHNLPTALTPFIGRVDELDELGRWTTDPSNRLLTLTAPGGMGKSRLALTAAENALRVFHDGVYFVPLAPVTSLDAVVSHIASVVRCPTMHDGRSPQQQLCDFLSNKHLLLVLDNFEHLLDAADLVTAMLQSAPKLKVLVTSRERLNLSAEMVYTIGGLHFPDDDGPSDLTAYHAVQLFVESALRADPRFVVSPADIAAVCRLVQGMPLAIELAAAWASMMTPAEVAAEIENSADFLSTTARDVPERQRSVRAVFDMTWARLTDSERSAFAAMSVFRAGCTQDAAFQVTGASKPVIATLIGKALIWRNPETGRLSIHELLRQYAAEALETRGQALSVRDAHRTYYAAYTDKWSLALRDDQLNALDHLDREYHNIVRAFETAIGVGTPEAILPFTDLWFYFTIRGYLKEGARLFDVAIEALDGTDSVALGKLFTCRAQIASNSLDDETERRSALRSVEILKGLDAEHELSFALAEYGNAFLGEDHERALEIYHESLTLAERVGDTLLMAVSTHLIGYRLRSLGRIAEARPWTQRSHACFFQLNNQWGLAHTYFGLYDQARVEGDWLTARQMLEESLKVSQLIGSTSRMAYAYYYLAQISIALERPRDGVTYALSMLRMGHRTGDAVAISSALFLLAELYAEIGEFAQSAQQIREQRQHRTTLDSDTLERLTAVGSLLFRAGLTEQAAAYLSVASERTHYAQMSEVIRQRYDTALETCRKKLGDARYEEIAEAASKKSLEELHAELYAILNSPPFVQ